MEKLIDANVILRYLLRDNEEMAEAAKNVIDGGAYTTAEVLAEVVYVLNRVYKINRETIAYSLITVLSEVKLYQSEVYCKALTLFAERKLDFVDCILIARHRLLGEEIFSFDKKLNRHLEQ